VAESVNPQYPSILGWSTDDQAYIQELRTLLTTNSVLVLEDTDKANISLKLRTHYQQFQTRASVAVPIILGHQLLGALIANQCSGTRCWQPTEIDLLQKVSEQLAIAIHQSLICQELAALNINLERQVEERTAQLQQKMQELEELHRVKDVVLHTVAHDLRTSVMGNLMVLKHLLKNQGLGTGIESISSLIPVSGSIIRRMIQGNDRQLEMLDSLLEIHSSEKKGVILNRQQIRFNTLLELILAEVQPILAQNQGTLTNLLPKDLPLVMADVNQLQKVITNLLTYCLRHNPPGLHLTLKAQVKPGHICTHIQDQSTTMSKLECDRLFDLHIRDPQSPCSTSISLKMYLCQQIIQAHGGKIGVISKHHHGLDFWFTLPIA
jgi:signal transduction histidine kinase